MLAQDGEPWQLTMINAGGLDGRPGRGEMDGMSTKYDELLQFHDWARKQFSKHQSMCDSWAQEIQRSLLASTGWAGNIELLQEHKLPAGLATDPSVEIYKTARFGAFDRKGIYYFPLRVTSEQLIKETTLVWSLRRIQTGVMELRAGKRFEFTRIDNITNPLRDQFVEVMRRRIADEFLMSAWADKPE